MSEENKEPQTEKTTVTEKPATETTTTTEKPAGGEKEAGK